MIETVPLSLVFAVITALVGRSRPDIASYLKTRAL